MALLWCWLVCFDMEMNHGPVHDKVTLVPGVTDQNVVWHIVWNIWYHKKWPRSLDAFNLPRCLRAQWGICMPGAIKEACLYLGHLILWKASSKKWHIIWALSRIDHLELLTSQRMSSNICKLSLYMFKLKNKTGCEIFPIGTLKEHWSECQHKERVKSLQGSKFSIFKGAQLHLQKLHKGVLYRKQYNLHLWAPCWNLRGLPWAPGNP